MNVIGVDFGGTHIRAALVTDTGKILARAETLTLAEEGQEAVIGRIEACIKEIDKRPVAAIGIAAPGPIDPWKGVLHQAPNLPGWREVPLADILSRSLGIPVRLNHDAKLAALGEHRFGAGRGAQNLVYVTIGTGIGAGVIAKGRLLLGANGMAGEVGHIILEPEGPLCGCGNRGCLEVLAAGPAIARQAVEQIHSGARTMMQDLVEGDLGKITAKVVGQAARDGDKVALSIYEKAGSYIGWGIANLLNILDPELVILGGGVAKAGDILFHPIRAAVATKTMPPIGKGTEITPAALGDDAGLLGAAVSVLGRAPRHAKVVEG